MPSGTGRTGERVTLPIDLSRPHVVLRLQRYPGTDGSSAIDGFVPLVLPKEGGGELFALDGDYYVPLDPAGEQTVELHAGGARCASWTVSKRYDLPPPDSIAGICARLNHLGYNAGKEDSAGGSEALERAVLTFEADQDLPLQGATSQVRIEDPNEYETAHVRVRPETHERLQAVVERELGSSAAASGGAPDPEGGMGYDSGRSKRFSVLDRCRVTLVRFDQCEEFEDPSRTPYVDDRGYAAEPHCPTISVPAPLGELPEEGEVWKPPTFAVELVREGLSNDAPLVVESASAGVSVSTWALQGSSRERVELSVSTTLTAELQSDDRWQREVDVLVRLGAMDGPVVHTLRVLVLRPLPLRLGVVRILHKGDSTDLTKNTIRNELAEVSRILGPAGIGFDTRPAGGETGTEEEDVALDYVSDHDFDYSAPPDRPDDLDEEDVEAWEQENLPTLRMISRRHHPDRLNIYVVGNHPALLERRDHANAVGFVAFGYWKEKFAEHYPDRRPVAFVICSPYVFRDETARGPHVLAHEIGHVIGLRHPDERGAETWTRVNSWFLRRLMFIQATGGAYELPSWHPFASKGGVRNGQQLTIKNLAHERYAEVHRLRRRLGSGAPYDGVRYPPEEDSSLF